MPKKTPIPNLDDVLRKAKSTQPGPDIYSNTQRVTTTMNELIIDFYTLMPNLTSPESPQAIHLQRIILPLTNIAEFIKILESTTKNVVLSVHMNEENLPEKDEDIK